MNIPATTLAILVTPLTMFHAKAGPFAPQAGSEGSTAVSLSDSSLVGWAQSVASYAPGSHVDPAWTDETRALGPASSSVFDVVSLGRGGSITLHYDPPIPDGEGWDFAVFENAFSDTFLELAFVEISSNGTDFHRFPTLSLTSSPVGPFGLVDPTDITGFAGRYRAGFGTPFDMEELDLNSVSHIRIVDVIGDGSTVDSGGNAIFDPFPTVGSAGFDLDAVAVRYQEREDSHSSGTGSDEDRDGDGYNALLEYALGMNPELPDPGVGAPVALPGGGLDFPYLTELADLRYLVEGSADLTSWREIAAGESGGAFEALADGVTVAESASHPQRIEVRAPEQRFLRLKVVQLEE